MREIERYKYREREREREPALGSRDESVELGGGDGSGQQKCSDRQSRHFARRHVIHRFGGRDCAHNFFLIPLWEKRKIKEEEKV